MSKARSAQRIAQRSCMVALAAIVAVALAFGALAPVSTGQAFAASGKAELQTAQVKPSTSPVTAITTKAVKKKYPSKQKMTMTMAGGDVTTIGTNGVGSKVKWSTSNKKVARVKSTGKYTAKVTALKPGKATISAKSDGGTLVCKVTVTGALSKTSITLTPFNTGKLTLKGATAKKWTSSSTSVVTVNKKGALTPKATGTATITCTDKKGYKYKCAVTVKCPAITCLMDSAKSNSYVKSFTLTNKSGKAVVLDSELISYYPEGIKSAGYSIYGLSALSSNPDNWKTFSDSAVTVANKASYSFYGVDDDPSTVNPSGVLGLRFSVGGVKYYAAFRTGGNMIACGRA